ncbi:MAG: ribonuclease P protein component [Lachnospiraceae bacterium]|nr:ribonuclease P protein component [Lachnospiraceae bacterium]
MKYSESLKKTQDFQVVYKQGISYANKYLFMHVRENYLNKNRIGISISKKVGNSVIRHHLARLIREGYRLQEKLFYIGYDIVIVVRVNGKNCTYHEIECAIYHLGKMHQIVKKNLV